MFWRVIIITFKFQTFNTFVISFSNFLLYFHFSFTDVGRRLDRSLPTRSERKVSFDFVARKIVSQIRNRTEIRADSSARTSPSTPDQLDDLWFSGTFRRSSRTFAHLDRKPVSRSRSKFIIHKEDQNLTEILNQLK